MDFKQISKQTKDFLHPPNDDFRSNLLHQKNDWVFGEVILENNNESFMKGALAKGLVMSRDSSVHGESGGGIALVGIVS